jgi:hypothetical protein
MFFVSEEFLNAPEFANVFVMSKMYEKCVRDSQDERLIQNWTDVQEQLGERVTNPARAEALHKQDPLEVLAKISLIE